MGLFFYRIVDIFDAPLDLLADGFEYSGNWSGTIDETYLNNFAGFDISLVGSLSENFEDF
jgi:hypothetical protein